MSQNTSRACTFLRTHTWHSEDVSKIQVNLHWQFTQDAHFPMRAANVATFNFQEWQKQQMDFGIAEMLWQSQRKQLVLQLSCFTVSLFITGFSKFVEPDVMLSL